MKVYYHSSEDMRELKDNSVALIVTSPPYPMIKKWDELFGTTSYKDQCKSLYKVWKECHRVLIDGGMLCINIGDATRTIDKRFECYPNYARTVIDCRRLGFTCLIPIFWKKISNRPNAFLGSGMIPTNGYIAQDCEYIAILRKGLPRQFPPKDKNRYASQFTKEERDKWFQQIWNIPGIRGAKNTSVFPKEIPYRLIRMFSVYGDLIVDPFAGENTVGHVAISLKRKYVGYEIRRDR